MSDMRLLTEIRDGIRDGVALLRAMASAPAAGASSAPVASDRDLDSQYGNPEVRMRVRDWSGPDMKGRRFSECPAEFLDIYADLCEWTARKADDSGERTEKGTPVSQFRRADAARARGWAARVRAGKVAPTQSASVEEAWGEDKAPW